MKRQYERFSGSHAPSNKTPSVTIQKRGMLSLNRAAYDLLKRPQAVQLYFSANEQAIGITPSDPKAPDAILLRKQRGSASYIIAGMAFCKWYDIDTSVARRYEAIAEEGDLYVDLKQPAKVVTSASTMRQQRVEETSDALRELQGAIAHLEISVQEPGARELVGEIMQLLGRYQPSAKE